MCQESHLFSGHYRSDLIDKGVALSPLFAATNAASEGGSEGARVGELGRALLVSAPSEDISAFAVEDAGRRLGGVIFTRLAYANDPRRVMLLSPMAVATDRQGEGIGD